MLFAGDGGGGGGDGGTAAAAAAAVVGAMATTAVTVVMTAVMTAACASFSCASGTSHVSVCTENWGEEEQLLRHAQAACGSGCAGE